MDIEILENCRQSKLDLERINEKIVRLEQSMRYTSPQFDRIPGFGSVSDVDRRDKYEKLVAKRLELIKSYLDARRDSEMILMSVTKARDRSVLWYYYVDSRTWSHIAKLFGVSYRRIMYIRARALREIHQNW